ncbi:hypothetical protein [Streptomyces sp. CB01881]|nr:hypothetical protein [Streptomyces sp. CB01881]
MHTVRCTAASLLTELGDHRAVHAVRGDVTVVPAATVGNRRGAYRRR